MQVAEHSPRGKLLDYLRLFRIPNVFTAVADVVMGFVLMRHAVSPGMTLGVLIAASALLYTAGMVLNDVFDRSIDAKERPERPLPSGRISLTTARSLGFGMLALGVGLAAAAGFLPAGAGWWSGAVALALAVTIVLYDGVLKRTPVAPLLMGACRGLNVMLGMSVADPMGLSGFEALGKHHFLAAGGIALYITGVTLFARTEAVESKRAMLAAGTTVMIGGIAVLGFVFRFIPRDVPRVLSREEAWWLLLGMLAFFIARRCQIAIHDPKPRAVQLAVKHSILSLIMLDASLIVLVGSPAIAISVALMLIPTLVLARWVYST